MREHSAAASADTTPVLSISDLHVRFRTSGRQVVHAVTGVSLDIAAGETLGLIGESGSGKSTVARAVSQLLRGERAEISGDILLGSTNLNALSTRRLRSECHRMQMIFQDPHDALDPRMTVRQSIEEPLRVLGRIRGRGTTDIADAALDTVGLPPAIGARRPHELSGGQRQRVNIARAMTVDPELLLCDEVVSALDVSIQADILNLLARLQDEKGLAYLFISHDLGVVATVSDRIGVMYLGRIVEVGSVDDIIDHPLHPYTEALLSAEPEALPRHLKNRNRIVLQGDIPSPISPPSGCGFRTRCRFAQPRCAEEVPQLIARPDGHAVACHFADELELVGHQTVAAVPASHSQSQSQSDDVADA